MEKTDGVKNAFSPCIVGHDGSYVTEWSLIKDDEVYGIIRRSSSLNAVRSDHIFQYLHDQSPHFRRVFGAVNAVMSLN